MRHGGIGRAVGAVALLGVLAGCSDPEPARTLQVPSLRLPTLGATPAPQSVPAGRAPSRSADPRIRYPLRLAEAQGFAGLGYPVAGSFPGGEIRVQKLVSTEWETVPVTDQVCKDRWDTLNGKFTYSCKVETVYKRQPVQKTKFWVSGAGVATVAYETVSQAFARLAPTDYWRRIT